MATASCRVTIACVSRIIKAPRRTECDGLRVR
jgi:hypothetical protein